VESTINSRHDTSYNLNLVLPTAVDTKVPFSYYVVEEVFQLYFHISPTKCLVEETRIGSLFFVNRMLLRNGDQALSEHPKCIV
jgi:hypothetical protein